jgi:hypothetical protein
MPALRCLPPSDSSAPGFQPASAGLKTAAAAAAAAIDCYLARLSEAERALVRMAHTSQSISI